MLSLMMISATACSNNLPPLISDHSIDLCVSGIQSWDDLTTQQKALMNHRQLVNAKLTNCQLHIKCGVEIKHPESCGQ